MEAGRRPWLAEIAVAEADDGGGYGLPELAVVLENLGREVYGGPLLSCAVAAAVIGAHGSDAQRIALLPGLATGSHAASVATGVGFAPALDGRFVGDAGPALGATWASLHVVRCGEDAVVFASDVVQPVALEALDPALGVARLIVDGPGEVLRGGGARLTRVLLVAVAAEAAGNARAALDTAVTYAKVREQFGRTIGSFQAIKHHLADMLVRSELAVAAAWDVARVDASGGPEADLGAAGGAYVALDAAVRNAQTSIQIVGGIGFTWEHDAHLFLRRALTLAGLVGSVDNPGRADRDAGRCWCRPPSRVSLPPEAERYRAQAREFVAQWHTTPPEHRRRLLVEDCRRHVRGQPQCHRRAHSWAAPRGCFELTRPPITDDTC